jgi:hypothetical protein
MSANQLQGRWLALALVVPLVAALSTYLATHSLTKRVTRTHPQIDYPRALDFGNHEEGAKVEMPFVIKNNGTEELYIHSIHSSCSCTGIERAVGGDYERISELRLKGGEEAELVMRLTVRGVQPGQSIAYVVDFQTNDPTQPECRMIATVKCTTGRVACHPRAVAFGSVPQNAKLTRFVDVWDVASPTCRIDRVSASNPDRIAVRVLREDEYDEEPEHEHVGMHVGRIEIVVNTATPSVVNSEVTIHLAGHDRERATVAVIGRITSPIEMFPSSIVLPRESTAGPVYSGECLIRSTSGEPVTVSAESVPTGLSVTIAESNTPAERSVRVGWDAKAPASPPDRKLMVRFRARSGSHESLLELPITLKTLDR